MSTDKKINMAIIGLGFGAEFIPIYQRHPNANMYAICRRTKSELDKIGDAFGIEKRYTDYSELLKDPEIDAVHINTPIPDHAPQAIAALKAGKHVICEKPMALSIADCKRMIAAAKRADRFLMIAHCIRFWPEYKVLKELVASRKYGKVLAASFWRKSATPKWSWKNWLMADERSGGAVVDLHIHDTDFVNYLLGLPKAVFSRGFVGVATKSAIDHVVTQYIYEDGPAVTAEGGWAMAPGFGFDHGFCVVLERATIEHDLKGNIPLTVHEKGGKTYKPRLPKGDGYVGELRYFVDCVAAGKKPSVVTPEDALNALKVCLAEARSVRSGRTVRIK